MDKKVKRKKISKLDGEKYMAQLIPALDYSDFGKVNKKMAKKKGKIEREKVHGHTHLFSPPSTTQTSERYSGAQKKHERKKRSVVGNTLQGCIKFLQFETLPQSHFF